MSETVEKTGTGAILYDRAVINQIGDACLRRDGWRSTTPVTGALRSAGRGNTLIVSDGRGEYVLRHYRRGGLPGRINQDRYLWLGPERTRAFAEWRLLRELTQMGLPVPTPAAASYRRVAALFYTADLLTVRIPGIRSLADRLMQQPGDARFWRAVGECVARFHRAGVNHADLNAYNVQIGAADGIYLLDFDRGRLMAAGAWQQRNLARLYRSLQKVKRLEPGIAFSQADWQSLLQGYESAR